MFIFSYISFLYSHGGFFPFGFSGTLSGAATCFFAYIGFEGIAIASEEARDPEKSIPRATVLSLLTVTTLYLLVTAALTLMIPYYETNTSGTVELTVFSLSLWV